MSEQLVRKTIHIDAADVERADRVLDQIEQELVDGVIRLRKEDNRGQ